MRCSLRTNLIQLYVVGQFLFVFAYGAPDGSVRLVDGLNSKHGRLEIYHEGTWGTVCDDGFTDKAAVVICRMLGFSTPYAKQYQTFKVSGTGKIWLDDVNCRGNEANISECSHASWGTNNCGHGEDVGVSCAPDGSVRLVDGPSTKSGRLEIYHEGIWGTVCDDSFTDAAAAVVCSMLGFSTTYAKQYQTFKVSGKGKIWLDDVNCQGNEANITECSHASWGTNNCGHGEDVGVSCEKQNLYWRIHDHSNGLLEIKWKGNWHPVCRGTYDEKIAMVMCRHANYSSSGAKVRYGNPSGTAIRQPLKNDMKCSGSERNPSACMHYPGATLGSCLETDVVNIECATVPVRLIGGNTTGEGRVEVKYSNTWGTICSNGFDTTDAKVICNMLNFSNKLSLPEVYKNLATKSYGTGTGPIWLSNLNCQGIENDILACSHSSFNNTYCNHDQDVAVNCNFTPVRLLGGKHLAEGRIELYHNGVWGTICDDNFGTDETKVICRMLGFSSTRSVTYYGSAHFGQGTGPILLRNIECNGNENDISKCRIIDGWIPGGCSHTEDVSVNCEPDFKMYLNNVDKGTLTVQTNGKTFTVCDDDLSKSTMDSVCRSSGYNRSISLTSSSSSSPKIALNDGCTFEENTGFNCSLVMNPKNCDSSDSAYITCDKTRVRLRGGTHFGNGRVEVFHDNLWGTVCSNGFDSYDAEVVCRTLGFGYGSKSFQRNAYYGKGSGPVWVSDLRCTGKEVDINMCDFKWGNNSCPHSLDIGVECSGRTQARLVNGSVPFQGRVELLVNSSWRALYSSPNVNVICRMLGYNMSEMQGETVNSYLFGHLPSGSQALTSSMSCSGQEYDITACIENYNRARKTNSTFQLTSSSYGFQARCRFSSIRLSSGPSRTSGRLEIYRDRRWGTLCSKNWTDEHATYFCKMIVDSDQSIHVTGKLLQSSFYGKGSGAIWKIKDKCNGDFAKCLLPEDFHTDCSHDHDAAIYCYGNIDVRLVHGNADNEGTVMLKYNGMWGALCDDSVQHARPICHSLGYWSNSPTMYSDSWFGRENITTWRLIPNCYASDIDLGLCFVSYYFTYTHCSQSDEAGVRCLPTAVGTNAIEIEERYKWKGPLLVKINNNHGYICSDGWSDENTKVACRMMGYRGNAVSTSLPKGKYPIFLTNMSCSGQETDIGLCKASYDVTHCQGNIVGMDCTGGLKIRLTGGKSPVEGRVEIYANGTWNKVCGNSWSVNNAKVVCNVLGYRDASPDISVNGSLNAGSSLSIYPAFQCSGSESHILQCSKETNTQCLNNTAATVKCFDCFEHHAEFQGTITSPNYPSAYGYNTDCFYIISPPKDKGPYILFLDSLSMPGGITNHFLEIRDGIEDRHLYIASSYYQKNPFSGYKFEVRFKSNSNSYSGFKMSWRPIRIEDAIIADCGSSSWNIKVNMTLLKKLYPDSSPELIFLNNPSCKGKMKEDVLLFDQTYSQCGTSRTIQSSEILYQNFLKYPEASAPLPPIIRHFRWIKNVQCRITKQDQGGHILYPDETTAPSRSTWNNIGHIAGTAASGVHVTLYKDSNFNVPLQNNHIYLGEKVYVKVEPASTSNNYKMVLQSCSAAPYSGSSQSYQLISNGCPVEQTTNIISRDTHSTRFVFESFEFPSNTGRIYVSCTATTCLYYENTPECQQTCQTKRSVNFERGTHVLLRGVGVVYFCGNESACLHAGNEYRMTDYINIETEKKETYTT